jgi:hypothetical protein
MGLVAAAAFMLEGCDKPSGDPTYRGKPLSIWLGGYAIPAAGTEDPRKAQDADEAILHLGTNTIPFLIDLLRHGRPEQANEAMQAFSTLGPVARSAVPAMLDLYEKNPSFAAREVIPIIVCRIGKDAPETVPLLLRALAETNDPFVRGNAAEAIRIVHPPPHSVVAALTQAIKDPDLIVRTSAADALALFGADSKPAVPTLLQRFAFEQAKIGKATTSWTTSPPQPLGFRGGLMSPGAYTNELQPASAISCQAIGDALLKIDPAAAAKVGVKRE